MRTTDSEDLSGEQGPLTISQINALGERLRALPADGDVRRLVDYQATFQGALQQAVRLTRTVTELPVTQRPQKSIRSILRKLERLKTRLSKMQDLAGFRIIVGDIAEQDGLVGALSGALGGYRLDDRRATPSHGYRAVHVIWMYEGRAVEIQIRTELQHLWAELCEGFDRQFDGTKYGGGPAGVRTVLNNLSNLIQRFERLAPSQQARDPELRDQLALEIRRHLDSLQASPEERGAQSPGTAEP